MINFSGSSMLLHGWRGACRAWRHCSHVPILWVYHKHSSTANTQDLKLTWSIASGLITLYLTLSWLSSGKSGWHCSGPPESRETGTIWFILFIHSLCVVDRHFCKRQRIHSPENHVTASVSALNEANLSAFSFTLYYIIMRLHCFLFILIDILRSN